MTDSPDSTDSRDRSESHEPPDQESDSHADEPESEGSSLVTGKVSIMRTQRRRYFWAAWWTGEPERIPFRKPDASNGGASSAKDALRDAERAAGRALTEVDSLWARGWNRILRGMQPFSDAEARRVEGDYTPPPREMPPESIWTTLDVPPHSDPEIIRSAFRKRALETHPDQGGDSEAFRRVEEAYRRALSRTKANKRSKR